jgi:3-hydroxyacyl-CoA dehydrogenase
MESPQTIGVIGAGTMGSGIAQVCALSDFGRKSGRGFYTYS